MENSPLGETKNFSCLILETGGLSGSWSLRGHCYHGRPLPLAWPGINSPNHCTTRRFEKKAELAFALISALVHKGKVKVLRPPNPKKARETLLIICRFPIPIIAGGGILQTHALSSTGPHCSSLSTLLECRIIRFASARWLALSVS